VGRKHQIQPGDTLSAIAKQFYGDATLFGLIAAANQLADLNKILPGQVLSIPDLPSHWDVVQVTGGDQIRKLGNFVVKVACNLPAGMRLVIESVSGRCVQQQGMLFPLALGEVDALGQPEQPLACFPWVQSFYSADLQDAESRGGSRSTSRPVCTWPGRSITSPSVPGSSAWNKTSQDSPRRISV
jgi:LysM repeat protein